MLGLRNKMTIFYLRELNSVGMNVAYYM